MHFLSPYSLLLLAPMGGLIVLMYILKLRRKDVIVSSTFLWRQVIRDVQANSPFQKLRKNLLLFLQLLAVALLVFLLSRPYWKGRGLGGRSVVIIVDTSASMMATDVGRNRLEEAKQEALKLVRDMKTGDQMMIISASAKPEAKTGFTGERTDLNRAIDALKPHETITAMRDAANLAAALVADRDASQIDIISDGAFPPITNVNFGKTRVAFHSIGKAGHNVGIAAVDYRRSLTGEKMVQVFVTVHNFDKVKRKFTVELSHDNNTMDAQEVELAPGGESPDIFEIPEPTVPLSIDVKLDIKDDLAADNQAAMVITPRRIVKTLLVTDENVFMENAIKVDPNIELSTVKLTGFTKPDGYDVVIFDTAAPKTLPEGNYFFVNCANNQSPATPISSENNQSLVDTVKSHPVLQYVDFGTNRWTSMRQGKPAGWGQEIATGESGAGVVAGEKGKMRAVWTGFDLDLAHGQFPLTVSYPIFISNAIRWLARSDDNAAFQIRTGATITLDAPPNTGHVTITKPDGVRRDLIVSSRGGVVFDDADQVGIYKVAGGNNYQRVFAANLADYSESDIVPQTRPDLDNNLPGKPGRPVDVNRDLWPWLAGILLILLAFEWWAFHRRVFVTS